MLVENRDFCLRHLHSRNKNGMATQRWKTFEDAFIRFDRILERDRRTPHDGIDRGYA